MEPIFGMSMLMTVLICLGSGVVTLLALGGTGALVWFILKSVRQDSGILKNGTPAQATILKVWETGTCLNNQPQLGFNLEVRPPSGAPYQAQAKGIIPMVNIPQFQPGAIVNVKISPTDPSKVALDVYGGAA
jgi:hypothetical protein